jgi:hypothetical protein
MLPLRKTYKGLHQMLTLDELTIDLKEMVDDKAPKLDKFMGKF